MKEAGAHAVKLEGGAEVAPQVEKLATNGIPVMAHIGFTPQSEHSLGGYRVQGRGDTASRLIDAAHAMEDAGAFAIVMEMVPGEVAAQITEELVDPDDRHRRGSRLRRPGARLAGRLRPAHRQDGPLRQAVRRPARRPARGRDARTPRTSRAARSPRRSTPSERRMTVTGGM